nr:MAG TPA: hypothetical protein [Bacteriophage sp.]
MFVVDAENFPHPVRIAPADNGTMIFLHTLKTDL